MQPACTANCLTAVLAILTIALGVNVFMLRKSNNELSAKHIVASDELMQSTGLLATCEKEKTAKETTLKEAKDAAEAAKAANKAAADSLETCKQSLQAAADEAAKVAEAKQAEVEASKAEAAKAAEAEAAKVEAAKTEAAPAAKTEAKADAAQAKPEGTKAPSTL